MLETPGDFRVASLCPSGPRLGAASEEGDLEAWPVIGSALGLSEAGGVLTVQAVQVKGHFHMHAFVGIHE